MVISLKLGANSIAGRLTSLATALLVVGIGASSAYATEVGVAAAVNSDAFGTPPGGARSTKVLGDNVIYNEKIETSGSGLVQVLLVDGSTFTVGANSNLVIDEFVYDPNAGTGKLVSSFGKGVARFVGGKLSKKRGGVTVKTPVGTIGIRGGIANINLASNPPVFSLLFGKDLTFTSPSGQRSRIHQAGYSMEVGAGGSTRVRRSTQSDFGNVQTALTNSRQRGGTRNTPTEGQIVQSGLPRVISGLRNVPTTPRSKPASTTGGGIQQTVNGLIQTQILSQSQNTQSIEQEESTGTTEITDSARILRAGNKFGSTAALNLVPGTLGIVGGTSGFDEVVVFTQDPDTSGNSYRLWTGTADGTSIYVFDPDTSVNEFYTQSVNSNGDVIENFSTSNIPDAPSLSGAIVQNARGQRITGDGFGFFAHFVATEAGSDPTFNYGGSDYFYGLYGSATDFDNFNGSDAEKLRTYTLHGDILTAFQLSSEDNFGNNQAATSAALFLNPSIAEDLGTSFLSSVKSSGLKVLEGASDTLEGARYLAASMYVSSGTTAQKSFVSLSLGDIENESGTLVLGGERRGGHRTDADNSAGLYGGSVESIEGGTGGTIFGSNADYLVLGPGNLEEDGTYTDGYVQVPTGIQSTDQQSGTMHVAELSSEVNVSTLDRTSKTLKGYAAGVLESNVNYSAGVDPVIFASNSLGDFEISFDSQNGSLYATLHVKDVANLDDEVDQYQLAFGEQSGSGQSVYIDADTFAAIETSGGSGNQILTDSEVFVSPKAGTTPDNYLISNTLVKGADNALFVDKTKCTCDFLEWGYWGSKMEASDTSLAGGDRFDTFHMGTWVAGDVTNSIDLPTSGSATFAGHAVGSVADGTRQYLAAGDFNMSLDFTYRTGTATISNFDSRTMSATLSETSVASGNLFEGTLSGTGGLSGNINTSVVTGPNSNHQGVIGDFHATQGNWSAAGIVAGEKQ
ncbi:FecR domain-containing protein [uncultured Roseibium sp.]|uniref:FecR domain-containing protein n=1 Tax=uncultured Roseibium sp. TaxID=1936171 RepID=UPI002605BDFE|nr:FecR domain-containing protein [uncultured Roseibium sp.]